MKIINNIVKIIEKYYKTILIVAAMTVVLVPVLVWLFYSVLDIRIETDISADGMLAYIGTIFNSIISLFIIFLSIYESKKRTDLEEEKRIDIRRKEIHPDLYISINKLVANKYSLKISNCSDNSAVDVYVYEYRIFPVVKANSDVCKEIFLGGDNEKGIVIDESYFDLNDDEYPKAIVLGYYNTDHEMVTDTFRCIGDGLYQRRETEYM